MFFSSFREPVQLIAVFALIRDMSRFVASQNE